MTLTVGTMPAGIMSGKTMSNGRIRVYKALEGRYKGLWVRECPCCPDHFVWDYWTAWKAAMANAQRHVLMHTFEGRGK